MKYEYKDDPFPYLTLEECFDDYKNLANNLPDTSLYTELKHKDAKRKDGSYTRLQFDLNPKNLAKLPEDQKETLTLISAYLKSGIPRNFFFNFFSETLKARFGDKFNTVRKNSEAKVFLTRDFPGYFIRPHCDAETKVITTLFYLPKPEECVKNIGTAIYKNKDTKLFNLDFAPNTGFSFPVTKKSWHGVDKLQEGQRDVLMLIYYYE